MIGFYTVAIGICFGLLSIFIFYLKDLDIVNQSINEIIFALKNSNLLKSQKNPPKKKLNILLKNSSKNKKRNKSKINSTNIGEQSYEITLNPKESREEITNKVTRIMKFNEEELNKLQYDLALKYDSRSYCQYYTSLLRINYILIFAFTKDYNSRIIKLYLLILNFIIYFTTNALFFNNNNMHHIYT